MKHLAHRLLLTVVGLASLIGFASDVLAEKPETSIRVLILTGRNNHNWRETTPMLQKVLESTGKFDVDTAVPPKGLTRENLKNYDVILSNWNSFGSGGKEAEAVWTPENRQAYLDFVSEGKGHVTVHAGGCSFYQDWPEYRKVSLVYWKMGATGHGRQHEFNVRIEKTDHLLSGTLKEFSIRDELWNRPGVVEGATVVASAYSDKAKEGSGTNAWEPTVVTATYGKGRCFATLLGHDAKIMEQKPFRQILIQGVEWAATGSVSSSVTPEAK